MFASTPSPQAGLGQTQIEMLAAGKDRRRGRDRDPLGRGHGDEPERVDRQRHGGDPHRRQEREHGQLMITVYGDDVPDQGRPKRPRACSSACQSCTSRGKIFIAPTTVGHRGRGTVFVTQQDALSAPASHRSLTGLGLLSEMREFAKSGSASSTNASWNFQDIGYLAALRGARRPGRGPHGRGRLYLRGLGRLGEISTVEAARDRLDAPELLLLHARRTSTTSTSSLG